MRRCRVTRSFRRDGQAGPIKYVIYIIKENRTYDQILGDLTDGRGKPLGNGDPKLTMYGEKVTPNQHALAREYVLLDNLFSNSEVSVDGHSWCDAAIATDFNQRSWMTIVLQAWQASGQRRNGELRPMAICGTSAAATV